MARIRIGTSGWIYKSWRGAFYPQKLPQNRWFEHYSREFDTVEINATFYRLPTQAAVARWREAAPDGFVFAWKASRFITHMKRLLDAEASLERVFAPMAALGDRQGPVLFQLPPQMGPDLDRLGRFLDQLPQGRRHVLEVRHPGWYVDAVFRLLEAHGVALCTSDHHHAPAPWVATADFVYVRGHGPQGRYDGSYTDETLATWAQRIEAWAAEGRDVYAYFDNDIDCAAPGDAARLKARVRAAEPRRDPPT
jgi:uncharacterized protein YecE (DUF72 family)